METYLGTILLVPYDFVPSGWAACDGASLQVSQYQALYSLLGNRFGGTAPQTFALPNMLPSTPANCKYIIALEGLYPQRP
ncbi:MAG TPA: phage tail protein [Kofleriaceae bacterium]|nr:phage tail protein [Kofleriaceae bacterium]